MHKRARRLLARPLHAVIRRALLVLSLLHPGLGAADTIVAARYDGPTSRYAHGVLGDDIEYETLTITLKSGETVAFTLPENSVFEDTAPRLLDLNGDGDFEVISVESDQQLGSRLAVYGPMGRIVATPHIGTRFRWLAPLGAADLDDDGKIELAYVDRPHLAKMLRIWRYEDGTLSELSGFKGVSNHRIGETDIAGGIRTCAGKPEMILASANWKNLLALRFDGASVTSRTIGSDTSRASFARAMTCRKTS